MKDKFEQLLRSTGREGVDIVLRNLDKLGFFQAPASTVFHLNCEGGLLEHSLNVCDMALMLREQLIARDASLEKRLPMDSVIIVSLLHDVCKSEIYKKGKRNKKNPDTGRWEEVDTYEVDYSACPLGHGEKSVIRLLQWGFKLSMDEILAIRWHMNAWDLPFQSAEMKGNCSAAKDKAPLCALLQCADGLASGILETTIR
ncbi:MAG: HD family phosphohydrolase [Bacteroidales bacterium]|nr:HD family phosphohydrolase [Bacteroidales bacterium]